MALAPRKSKGPKKHLKLPTQGNGELLLGSLQEPFANQTRCPV